MVQTRIELFSDIKGHIDFFEKLPDYDTDMYTHKKMKTTAESSYEALSKILPVLEETSDWSNDALYELLKKFAEENGLKNGQILWPLRTAVSGKQMTPGGATELMEILGREESLIRIKAGIELLKDSIG